MASVQDIDFLPIEYRQQHASREVQPWRIVVVVVFSLLLAAAAFTQYRQKRQAKADLIAVDPAHDAAVGLKSQLTELQARLEAVECDAGLYTYLRHPWPRTQLLAAVVEPLPSEIALYQIQVGTETPAEPPQAEQRPPADSRAEEEKLKKAPPTQRDRKRLCDEWDKLQAVVRIAGITTDTAALYRYLGVLSKHGLFAKAELRSVESLETPQGTMLRFQAILSVRPGYGQPGGPERSSEAENRKAEKKPNVSWHRAVPATLCPGGSPA